VSRGDWTPGANAGGRRCGVDHEAHHPGTGGWTPRSRCPIRGSTRVQPNHEIRVPELHLAGTFTCMAAPVQAEGSISDHAFYFRARGQEWSFGIVRCATEF